MASKSAEGPGYKILLICRSIANGPLKKFDAHDAHTAIQNCRCAQISFVFKERCRRSESTLCTLRFLQVCVCVCVSKGLIYMYY